jgi:hypothetical protein
MRKVLVITTFYFSSIGSWAQKTHDMSHGGSSGDVFIGTHSSMATLSPTAADGKPL